MSDQIFDSVDVYDIMKNNWSEAPPLITARKQHSSCALGNFIYVVAGAGYSNTNGTQILSKLNTIEQLDAGDLAKGLNPVWK